MEKPTEDGPAGGGRAREPGTRNRESEADRSRARRTAVPRARRVRRQQAAEVQHGAAEQVSGVT